MSEHSLSSSDTESPYVKAIAMLKLRFNKHSGKRARKEEKTLSDCPFPYLDREQQRYITRKGHPEELSFTQHLTCLCGMALEVTQQGTKAYGIVTHMGQLLEDSEYIP